MIGGEKMNFEKIEKINGNYLQNGKYDLMEQISSEQEKMDFLFHKINSCCCDNFQSEEDTWEMFQELVNQIGQNTSLLVEAQCSNMIYYKQAEWLADIFEEFGSATLYATGQLLSRLNSILFQNLKVVKRRKKEYDSILERCVSKLEEFLG